MLDTNLKKSHKLKNWIIALIVLLPSLLLVCLYPQMEKAMLDKKAQWEAEWEEVLKKKEEPTDNPMVSEEPAIDIATDDAQMSNEEFTNVKQWYLADDFVNYAVEASYYQYAMLLQETSGQEVYTEILEKYGWINDYYHLIELTPYEIWYQASENESTGSTNKEEFGMDGDESFQLLNNQLSDVRLGQLAEQGVLGYFSLSYDSYGKLKDVKLRSLFDNLVYDTDYYNRVKNSINQYETNAQYFEYETGDVVNSRMQEVCPKDFTAVYVILQENERFVSGTDESCEEEYVYEYGPNYQTHDYYFAIGAYWIVLVCVIFVALAAFILPFFKKLEIGWEKLFSIPFEVMCIVGTCAVLLGIGMCLTMSLTTMTTLNTIIIEQERQLELLGYVFTVEQCYWMLVVVNFFGWALAFFLEYMTITHIRQFFEKPMYYLKHRLIAIIFLRWIWRQCKRLYRYVTDIDINEKLHGSIVKLVLANFVIVTLLCCLWFAGIFGVIIYSVLLYILLRKYGNQLQRRYQSILGATGQMAQGDLRITLDEDLGIFEPLGRELYGVQQGFAKAVAEEAKSQNMKSELITNVSHDLKTPLTAIITYVDLLKKDDITEEERRSYIETLDLKSQRLKVLIEDLFEVSKANSGNVKMNFMDVDIVKLMKEVRVEMSDKMEQSNLDFRFHLPEEKVVLSLDGQRTYRIFENLLNNAMKYAMPFTRVYVDILNKESEVVLTFKNMSAQELDFDPERLTDRFVRGDSSRNSEGSGLGLAIAKSFTELQNGQFEIRVDGDLFKVTIIFFKK